MSRFGRALQTLVNAVREDHALLHHYDAKYSEGRAPASLPRDLVTRVGFQMLAACRAMRFCRDAGIPLAPQVVSRAIRHLYGSDIHWDATIEPGIVVVHGMGLAVSPAARIGRGAILFQHVTLGAGVDPATRTAGAPTLQANVHVGAGSTLVGPITIGTGSKVMGNCLVRASVPAGSLVQTPSPTVIPRARVQGVATDEVDS